jgi:hypothetical protein
MAFMWRSAADSNESDQRGDGFAASRRYCKVVIQWADILQWMDKQQLHMKLLGSKFTRILKNLPTVRLRRNGPAARPSSAEPLEDPLRKKENAILGPKNLGRIAYMPLSRVTRCGQGLRILECPSLGLPTTIPTPRRDSNICSPWQIRGINCDMIAAGLRGKKASVAYYFAVSLDNDFDLWSGLCLYAGIRSHGCRSRKASWSRLLSQ